MKNKIITAQQAVDLIPDGATIMMGGFVGCGSALYYALLALEKHAAVLC